MTTLLVPQIDIDKIEEARCELHKLVKSVEDGKIKPTDLFVYVVNITQPMWVLTHRKYKETLFSKIKSMLVNQRGEK